MHEKIDLILLYYRPESGDGNSFKKVILDILYVRNIT